MNIQSGNAVPLGATVKDNGVNFCLFSPLATQVELLLFAHEKDAEPKVIQLDRQTNKTYYYWHVFVEGLKAGTLYGYRVYGDSNSRNLFDASKVLLDPYGKAIVGEYDREFCKVEGQDNVGLCMKNSVVDEVKFDWGNTRPPQFSNSKNVIYELHPKGFTAGLDIENAGTFAALTSTIPYLKKLGINTIEMMPIFHFDSQDAPPGKSNYWGYSPISFFALHAPYCASKDPHKAILEFKQCIKTFHQNNIKVVLDVVYNHTAESDFSGPTYGFKGIANSTYYYIDKKGEFLDFTGCGNTINSNHSVVRRMILDSLRYWKEEFHIDGFRFDLAGVMTRDEEGNHVEVPPIIWEIDSEPTLAESMIIAEPWDVKGYNASDFPGDKWSIWQDHFRDTMRKSIRGDEGMIESFMQSFTSNFPQDKNEHLYYKPQRNIHFITCHDGFTLNDLVSYNDKHNWDNGEENRDGSNNNLSYNYGQEGPSSDENITQLRQQQMRNFFFCLILSHGTPMLNMGDEVARTQKGNNNPYSLDIPDNWMNWEIDSSQQEMYNFAMELITLRENFKVFTYKNFFKTEPNEELPFLQLHGVTPHKPDLSYHSRSIAIEYVSPKFKENVLLIFNFYFEPIKFTLPEGEWEFLISTDSKPVNFKKGIREIMLEPRSCILLQNKA